MMTPRTNNVTRKDFEAEMQKLRDTLDRWRVPIQAEIDKHKHTLYGNGEVGMDERLRNIERSLGVLMKLAYIAVVTIGGYMILEIFKLVFSQ